MVEELVIDIVLGIFRKIVEGVIFDLTEFMEVFVLIV
jgi:hypothetical protein